jgi:choline-sulfatase
MQPTNTIFILSDEHNRNVLGCYGDEIVKTPHLDRLAARGVRFENAYCNSPVCVSSRASIATGRYPHQISAWDSVSPFHGEPKGWAGSLRDQGHEVLSIGKLHYRSDKDDNGFCKEIAPMYVHNGVGWLSSVLRDPPVPLPGAELMAGRIGAGETDYTAYDRRITELTCEWLAQAAVCDHDKPWVLYVGLVAPHFPLIAPQEFFDLYNDAEIPEPRQYAESDRPRHPVLDVLRDASPYDKYFDPEKVKIARQGYYGLTSFLDDNIGKILAALTTNGLEEKTRVIYTSDHGDNIGHRGLWGKSVMYDDSSAIPLIVAGPEIPEGLSVETPVSLVDLHPTLIEFSGGELSSAGPAIPGTSLSQCFSDPSADGEAFSEYHDWSAITGMFMLRTKEWKIVRYPGYPDQLFNIDKDPNEEIDLANDPAFADTLDELRVKLAGILDVEQVNASAFADQEKKIEEFGGPEAILASEEHAYTPAPSDDPDEVTADKFEP